MSDIQPVVAIPEPYRRLLTSKGPTVLSVLARDGSIQSSLVWSDLEDGLISISMSSTAPKLKRIMRNRKATILKVDPDNEDNYITLRCSLVRVESDGAIEHLDKLTKRHYDKEHWYGDVVPDNGEQKRNEVVVYLRPEQLYYT